MNYRSRKSSLHNRAQEIKSNVEESLPNRLTDFDFKAKDAFLPPSLITYTGAFLVSYGSEDLSDPKHVAVVGMGRSLDMVDGAVAGMLEMRTDTGAAIDAIADKIEMLLLAIESWKQNALPKPVIGYILAKNMLHTKLTHSIRTNHPNEKFETSKANKIAMLLDNVSTGILLLANSLEKASDDGDKKSKLRKFGYATLVLGMLAEIKALEEMLRMVDPSSELTVSNDSSV